MAGRPEDRKGTVSTDSGVLEKRAYSFTTRFENARGTNPEELIAAAHAGCFTMALSAELGKANLVPREPAHDRHRHARQAGFGLDGHGVPSGGGRQGPGRLRRGVPESRGEAAETGCPISRLLKARITMDAKLES